MIECPAFNFAKLKKKKHREGKERKKRNEKGAGWNDKRRGGFTWLMMGERDCLDTRVTVAWWKEIQDIMLYCLQTYFVSIN